MVSYCKIFSQQDNQSIAASRSTSLSSTADHISVSLNLLYEYTMPDDFIHDSHMHSDVQLSRSYADESIAMNDEPQYYDVTEHDDHSAVQPVISQQSLQDKEKQVVHVASMTTQENERRLPEPCPVPYSSFSQDVIEAIEKGQVKGNFRVRLIRQAADFYYGMCPHPNHFEYVTMAKTLCNKYPQLCDKKPVKGKLLYYVSIYVTIYI